MQRLVTLYTATFGKKPHDIKPLAGAGSSRSYYRLLGNDSTSVIGTVGDDVRENEAYIAFSRHFSQRGLPVPELLAVSADSTAYLQQDLGDTSLYDVVRLKGVESKECRQLLEESLNLLARFHAQASAGAPLGSCYPRPRLDEQAVTWDLNYFKCCFLKPVSARLDEEKLECTFNVIRSLVLADEAEEVLLLRDFQSRNIMVHDGHPYVIDFQGARSGNRFYDVASFLWQARLGLTDGLKWELAKVYISALKGEGVEVPSDWAKQLRVMALFRILQVLGAYGFRGLYEKKAQFVTSIRQAALSALGLLEELADDRLAYLKELLSGVAKDERFILAKQGCLTVTVTSFSFKKGIPEDYSGNGGGFVFDCRALHNPGRYDPYKKLTGLDRPVIEFLENDGGILHFLDHCYALVDVSVAKYIERGFTNLSVSFGCTGGQHRSVYSAQKMAEHIAAKFNCKVKLLHREQHISAEL